MGMECEKILEKVQSILWKGGKVRLLYWPFYYHIGKDGELNVASKIIYKWI